MRRKLVGVFGDRQTFERVGSTDAFDAVVEGPETTVGVRDPVLGYPGRTSVYEDGSAACVVWGEAYRPDDSGEAVARWLCETAKGDPEMALRLLNGSYVAVIDVPETTLVATDAIRSWEVFFTDAAGPRVFGSDATAVAQTIDAPELDLWPTYEFLILGGALTDRTPITALDRLPLDHALLRDGTRPLGRYRHEPRRFDYVGELAARLQRAADRRRDLPGRTGLLLSAGFDSRTILELDGHIDQTYTLGRPGEQEADVAGDLAEAYGTDHTLLEVDERYLDAREARATYTQGIKESLHIHHAGYADQIDVESIYHGLLWDTVLRGYFLPRDTVDVLGLSIPRRGVDPDPDPVPHLAGILGYVEGSDPLIEASALDVDTSEAFFDETIGPAFEAAAARETSVYAALERFGVQNVLSSPFRFHLADTYVEGLLAADRELIDWHLHTPPEVRTEATFRKALKQIDSALLEPRPPDRPHDSFLGNQVEKRLRQQVPGLEAFDSPLPDRRRVYEEANFDPRLLPDRPDLHALPPRVKLRIDDLERWLSRATDEQVSLVPTLPQL